MALDTVRQKALHVVQSLNWGSRKIWYSIVKDCFALCIAVVVTYFLLRYAVYIDCSYL